MMKKIEVIPRPDPEAADDAEDHEVKAGPHEARRSRRLVRQDWQGKMPEESDKIRTRAAV